MPRVTLFAKGNVDVHDSLHFSRVGNRVEWNGINEIVRARFPDFTVRVHHETFTRSDALRAATGVVPPELQARSLPLGAFTPGLQFSRRVFTTPCDVVVLSLQADVLIALWRHRRQGFLFNPHAWEGWPPEERRWLTAEFEPLGLLEETASRQHLEHICTTVRQTTGAHVLLYNLSAAIAGEQIHCHAGLEQILSTRIRRFNLAAIELSQALGISIVDVDAIVARAGADRIKRGVFHLNAEGQRLVAEEVTRILYQLGCFDRPGPAAGAPTEETDARQRRDSDPG